MSFFFRIRDVFKPPVQKLEKAELKSNDVILDYGCGPGSYTIVAAEMVGPLGTIHAADINPFAIEKVRLKSERKGLYNIQTITTDCKTSLDDNSIDKITCFDTFHDINDKKCVLEEFYRVLKPNGILVLDDHHFSENKIINAITTLELFSFLEKKGKVYLFTKKEK
jgi:ubiquinone/menaquinone biosynthesis C-methylase UbiE